MSNEEVHGDIFTVHIFVDIVSYGGGQSAPVRPQVVSVHERGASQNHAQFTATIHNIFIRGTTTVHRDTKVCRIPGSADIYPVIKLGCIHFFLCKRVQLSKFVT